jgi:hypothetical protein
LTAESAEEDEVIGIEQNHVRSDNLIFLGALGGYIPGSLFMDPVMAFLRTLALASLPLFATFAFANDTPADLVQAVKDYDQAQIKGDRQELERLLADDYTLVNSSGKLETKAELVADYTAPGYKLEPFVVQQPIEKVWSDGAVMAGVARLHGTDGGKAFDVTLRFADVWAKRHGKWQVIYTHVSRATPAG